VEGVGVDQAEDGGVAEQGGLVDGSPVEQGEPQVPGCRWWRQSSVSACRIAARWMSKVVRHWCRTVNGTVWPAEDSASLGWWAITAGLPVGVCRRLSSPQ
jgi:hypothetical protein